MATLYGFQNVAFYATNNPQPRWFLTREARNKALAALRTLAVERGLSRSAALAGIYPVRRTSRDQRLIGDAWENEADAED